MSRRKKKNLKHNSPSVQPQTANQPAPGKREASITIPRVMESAPALPDPITFEQMEDKIRGEETLLSQEQQKERESRDIKKKLDDQEVERRLDALRKQMGISRKHAK